MEEVVEYFAIIIENYSYYHIKKIIKEYKLIKKLYGTYKLYRYSCRYTNNLLECFVVCEKNMEEPTDILHKMLISYYDLISRNIEKYMIIPV